MSAFQVFSNLGRFLLDLWWLWLPVVLAIAFFDSWIYYIRRVYWQGIKWVILEVKPPRDTEQTPKIMEQVFAGFWGIFGTISTKLDKYTKGVLQDYFGFEMVGINGEIHFFFRVPVKYRNLVEAQIYGQYPQAEIKEVEDYVNGVPGDIPNKNWNLWGTKLKLAKGNAYPIRTYMQQVEIISRPAIPLFIDPLSGLMEVMTKLQEGEQIWIQVLFRPVADAWVEQSKAVVKEIMEKARIVTGGEEASVSMPVLSPGDRELLTIIEEKASKKAYECKVQFAYIARSEVYSGANIGATMGLFNQFAALNANVLRPDANSMTKAYYLFAAQRKIYKQRRMMRWLRTRSFWEKGYILNIEELASLCHFPTSGVKAPMTPWLESKKGEPPMGLPTA